MSRRFAVLADLEGAAGVRSPQECFPNFSQFHSYGLANMAADANAAAQGLVRGGADEVVILDGHLVGQALVSSSIEAPARLAKGTLLDELKRGGLAGVFLTGIHGKTGTPNSFSSNTIAPFMAARMNGDVVGDALLTAYLCSAFEVPVVGVSGDWVACEEVQWALPDMLTAPTKTGFDRASVRHHNPETARQTIGEVAERAAKATSCKLLKVKRAFRFELSFTDAADSKRAAKAVDGVAHARGRVLSFGGGSFEDALDFAARAVGSLYPGWVDGLGRRAEPAEPAGRTAGGALDPSVIEKFYGASAPYWSD